MAEKKETRGRKPFYEQTIERWYHNEFRKIQYSFYNKNISGKEFEIKKKELLKEKLEKELQLIKKNNEENKNE